MRKGQVTIELLLSTLVVIAFIGILAQSLSIYHKALQTEKEILEKRVETEEKALRFTLRDASSSKYNLNKIDAGQENLFFIHDQGFGEKTYRNKLFNDQDEKDEARSPN